MCYSCGCDMPDDSHDDKNAIIEETFELAAENSGLSVDEVKRNTLTALKKQFADTDEDEFDTLDDLIVEDETE